MIIGFIDKQALTLAVTHSIVVTVYVFYEIRVWVVAYHWFGNVSTTFLSHTILLNVK